MFSFNSNDKESEPSKSFKGLIPVFAQVICLVFFGVLPLYGAIQPKPPDRPVNNKETSSNAKETSVEIQEKISFKDYFDVRVTSEVEKKSVEAAKDEIAKVKGELSKDIVMPVISAIASIFAAFALKDVVQFLLDKNQKKEIEEDIERALRKSIVPSIVSEQNEELARKIENLDGYTSWLEHQILSILITQSIDELKKVPIQTNHQLLPAIERLGSRSALTMEKASNQFSSKYFNEIKQFEQEARQIKIDKSELNAETKSALNSVFSNPINRASEKELFQGQSIFQAQTAVLKIVLNKSIGRDSRLNTSLDNALENPCAQEEKNLEERNQLNQNNPVEALPWT